MFSRRRFCLVFFTAALLLLTSSGPPALAQSLDQLRASGAVGERFDGFAQALKSGAGATVDQVNAKRRKIYNDRAASEGVSPDQIGRVYAKQIANKAPPGTKILQENGAWISK